MGVREGTCAFVIARVTSIGSVRYQERGDRSLLCVRRRARAQEDRRREESVAFLPSSFFAFLFQSKSMIPMDGLVFWEMIPRWNSNASQIRETSFKVYPTILTASGGCPSRVGTKSFFEQNPYELSKPVPFLAHHLYKFNR